MEVTTLFLDPKGKSYLEFDFGEGAGKSPRAVLSTLELGTMKYDPDSNNPAREGFFSMLDIDPTRVLPLSLSHTRHVIAVSSESEARSLKERSAAAGGADGLVVSNTFFVPALTVADCMPIWLSDAKRKAFGLLHSGWKGTGILKEGVLRMGAEFGCRPADICVILGPSIGSCCYAVPEERALGFAAEFGAESIRKTEMAEGKGSHYLDLRAANLRLAESLGIPKLIDVRLCTSCSPYLGSYRRQGAANFTRMLALCGYF